MSLKVDLPAFKAALIRAGVTQRELGRRLALPESVISHVARGRMPLRPEVAEGLARELGVPVATIAIDVEDKSPVTGAQE